MQAVPLILLLLTTGSAAADDWQAAFCDDDVIAWLASDADQRPRDRSDACWTVHASAAWSAAHLELAPADAADRIAARFERMTGLTVQPGSAVAHRWRYARAEQPLIEGALFDADAGIVVCGDWCAGPSRIENAWLSGQAAAGRLLGVAALNRG